MNFLTKKHLSRRHFLRGSGSVIALPLLDAMIPAGVSAQPLATPRSRLACIYIAHGAVMKYWTPSTDGAGFELPQTLKSLEPFRERLNVISDMRLPAAYGEDASAGANHTRSSQTWLTHAEPGTGPAADVDYPEERLRAESGAVPGIEWNFIHACPFSPNIFGIEASLHGKRYQRPFHRIAIDDSTSSGFAHICIIAKNPRMNQSQDLASTRGHCGTFIFKELFSLR